MFRSFHKKAGFITNLDRRGIRDEVERLGRLVEKATQKEMNGRSGVAWTTDHWTSSNNEITLMIIGSCNQQCSILKFLMEELRANAYIMYKYLDGIGYNWYY